MIGVGDAIGYAVQLALLALLFWMCAAFMWVLLLNPLRSRSTAARILTALAAGTIAALLVSLLIRLFHGMLEVFLWIAVAATIGAFAALLKKVIDR